MVVAEENEEEEDCSLQMLQQSDNLCSKKICLRNSRHV